jgi:hypothetical protein
VVRSSRYARRPPVTDADDGVADYRPASERTGRSDGLRPEIRRRFRRLTERPPREVTDRDENITNCTNSVFADEQTERGGDVPAETTRTPPARRSDGTKRSA